MALSGNFYLALILTIISAEYLLNIWTERLNLKRLSPVLPKEFEGFYDPLKYAKSQTYLRETTLFEAGAATFALFFSIVFILAGGFNVLDSFARAFGLSAILTGLVFSFLLKFLLDLLELPFELYDTFVIEEKYGFNKTTLKTFALDFIKEWGLTVAIGAPALAAVLWIFTAYGARAWLYGWGFITALQLFMAFISPALLLPLFNKFTPLQDGPLRTEIEAYAAKERFKMSGIFVMDGSRRTSKTNAFFTGFGRFRRIVLFDTLIEKNTPQELTAVLAHEMGHYKKKHILFFTALAAAQTGFMLWLLSFFMGNRGLFAAFGMENTSVYASLVFFGFLYSPVSFFLGIFMNRLSRKYEFEADAYAGRTCGRPQALISALKKLAVDNLSNLTPHPFKVFLEYSHPPILERLRLLRKMT
ncbi:MAG: M48 family metallopeptidase [Elusimicrobia bacterium]|nr:M48 family metallopeptidase [Elusimicrobiota bacterium]